MNRSIIVLSLGIVILVCLYLYRVNEQFMPAILLDEFGYWSNAAHFVGRDWSAITSHSAYYSYGYSFLLAAILRFSGDYSAYKVALLANLIISILMLIVHYRILVLLFPNLSKTNAAVIATIVQMYPSNAGNLHIAWAELYLTFFFSISMYLLLLFLSTRRNVFLYLWCGVNFYTYIIHQRALGVIIASFLLVAYMMYEKRVSVVQVIIMLFLFLGLLLVHRYIKQDILDSVMVSSENAAAAVNDYPSIEEHVNENLNFIGLKNFIISLSGKVAFLIIATFGTVHLFIKNLRKTLCDNSDFGKKYCYVYIAMVAVLEMGIVAVFTMGSNRLDNILYGRYIEWFIQPLIMICFVLLEEQNLRKELLIASISTLLMCIYITYIYSWTETQNEYFFVCLQSLFVFYKKVGNDSYLLLAGAVFGFLLILLSRINKQMQLFCCATVLFLCFLYADVVCINRVLGSNYRSDIVTEIDEKISEGTASDVAYIFDGSQLSWYVADLQVYNKNRTIKEIGSVIDGYDPYEGYVLVNPESEDGKYLSSSGLVPLVANWQVAMYKMTHD